MDMELVFLKKIDGYEQIVERFGLRGAFNLDCLLRMYNKVSERVWNAFLERHSGFAPRIICVYEGMESVEDYLN